MRRAALVLFGLALVAPVGARQTQSPSPVPQIQNGRVETRTGTAIDREIAAVSAASATEPVWVAWRAPMVPGDRDMCSWYGDRLGSTRGMIMDDGSVFFVGDGVSSFPRPQLTAPTGPLPLEAGTNVVVLARLIGGSVERLRSVGDDCPMDAGGRTVYWLSNVTSAESLRFLSTLTRPVATDRTMFDQERTIANAAVRAIGYHLDAAANTALDGIATNHVETSVRRTAASTLASLRGAFGLQTLRRLLAAATDAGERRSLVGAIGQSREAGVVDVLRPLTRDADTQIRSDAVSYLVQRGGAAIIPEALTILASETDDAVRKRLVSSIGRLPGNAGVSALLQLARSADNALIRKEAVSSLSQSKDPRALALMEEILKR